jgi:hypothetical protein
MKARILFHCAAVVALVLILAATPSNATERRDPPIVQDAAQTQASSAATHATASGKKHSPRSTQKQKGTNASVVKKPSTGSDQNAHNAHQGAGGSSAAK